MSAIFKLIFEWATDPLSLPIAWYLEWLIMVVIGEIAYRVAFAKVGQMRDRGLIDSSTASSFVHWLIRLTLYVVMWAVTYGVILTVKFVIAHWAAVLLTLFALFVAVYGIVEIIDYCKKIGEKTDA